MTVFTYTYPCLRTRSGLSGLAPEPELLRGGIFYTHLLILPDSSGFSGLAPEAGIVTLSQFLHALIDFYGLVPFGFLNSKEEETAGNRGPHARGAALVPTLLGDI